MKIRKRSEEPRDTVITIRVSQSEKAILKELAATIGVSVGCYLLRLALEDRDVEAVVGKPDTRQMKIDGV